MPKRGRQREKEKKGKRKRRTQLQGGRSTEEESRGRSAAAPSGGQMPGWMGGTPAAAAWAQSEHTESVPFSRQKTAPAINHPPAAFQCLQSCSLLSQLHQSAAGFCLHSPGRALVSAHVKGLAKRSGFFLQLDSRHSRCSQPASQGDSPEETRRVADPCNTGVGRPRPPRQIRPLPLGPQLTWMPIFGPAMVLWLTSSCGTEHMNHLARLDRSD